MLLGVAVSLAQCPWFPAGLRAADSFDCSFISSQVWTSWPETETSSWHGVRGPWLWACLIQGLPFTRAMEAEDSNREIHSGLLTSTRLSVLLLLEWMAGEPGVG